jgi:hypothetical protein
MKFLESWEHIEPKHASALDSTVACARAAVCRLPLSNGAKVYVFDSQPECISVMMLPLSSEMIRIDCNERDAMSNNFANFSLVQIFSHVI